MNYENWIADRTLLATLLLGLSNLEWTTKTRRNTGQSFKENSVVNSNIPGFFRLIDQPYVVCVFKTSRANGFTRKTFWEGATQLVQLCFEICFCLFIDQSFFVDSNHLNDNAFYGGLFLLLLVVLQVVNVVGQEASFHELFP